MEDAELPGLMGNVDMYKVYRQPPTSPLHRLLVRDDHDVQMFVLIQ